MQRPILTKTCQQFLAFPNNLMPYRTVTDIPWYKVTDESHLHIVDSRSTRRKFDLKVQKLEKQRLAAERRRQTPKQLMKPSELPKIELPNYIERGPSDILRAIGGCLKRDFTAPDYKFHDDPFLIPYNSMQKRDYLLSKQGGKRAARYVLNQHPELFNKNLIEMDPVIKRLLPKIKITKKNATPNLLESLIEGCNVTDAKEVYEILGQEKIEISIQLKQDYLEMLCFHNSNDEEMEEDFNETKGVMTVNQNKWIAGGAADHLANEIIKSEGLKSEAAHKARLALIQGKAKFQNFNGVLQTCEDVKANGGKLDTLGYNALILATANQKSCEWIDVKNILIEMNSEGVKPDRLTLLYIFQGLSNFNIQANLPIALAILAEFKILNIQPCLGTYKELLLQLKNNPKVLVVKDVIKELSKVQKDQGTLVHEIISENCFTFFSEAMKIARDRDLLDVAHQINDLVMGDPNADVLRGDQFQDQVYHNAFLTVLMRKEPLETFISYLDLYTPHVWSPPLHFYASYLALLEKQHAPQHLPKLWTDLVESEFSKAPLMVKMELIAKIGKAMKRFGDTGDDVLRKTMGRISEEIFKNLELNYAGFGRARKIIKTTHDEQILNISLDLCLEFGNGQAARKIVKFCQENFTEIDGNLGAVVLERYVKVMIEESDSNEAYNGIVFTNGLKHVDTAEELAVLAGANLIFEKLQKQTLNSMFSSSSKWKML